jgi:hypothetical protein
MTMMGHSAFAQHRQTDSEAPARRTRAQRHEADSMALHTPAWVRERQAAERKAEVHAWRTLALLTAGARVTLESREGRLQVIITGIHAGDDSDLSKAYATGTERYTRAEVKITASRMLAGVYSLREGWTAPARMHGGQTE